MYLIRLMLLPAMLVAVYAGGQAVIPGWTYPAETRNVRVLNAMGEPIWAGTDGGLIGFPSAGGPSVRFGPGELKGGAYWVSAIERDGLGLWALAAGRLWKYDGRSWTATDKYGTSMLQLSDGTLAICTADSLIWYRAGAWEGIPFIPGQARGRIYRSVMVEAADGRVWVGATWADDDIVLGSTLFEVDTKSGLLVRSMGGPRSPVGTTYDWTRIPEISSLASDQGGDIWVSDQASLYRVTDTGFSAVPASAAIPTGITCLLAGKGGGLWIGTGAGLFKWDDIHAANSSISAKGDPETIQSLSHGQYGAIWACTPFGVRTFTQDASADVEVPSIPLPTNRILSLSPGPDGVMWVGTQAGLARHSGGGWTAPQAPGFPGIQRPAIQCLAVDGDGAVWGYALEGFGLFRFRPRSDGGSGSWTLFQGGLDTSDTIDDIAIGSEGTIWAAGRNALYRFADEQWEPMPDLPSVLVSGLKSLAYDGKGSLWVGTPSALMRFDGTAWHAERDSGMMDLVFDSRGRLWGQGTTGFYRLEAGQWRKLPFPANREVTLKTIHALAAGPEGTVWFQHLLCGPTFCPDFPIQPLPVRIGYLTDDSIVVAEMELPSSEPTAIAFDDRGVPWIGTLRGLVVGDRPVTAGITLKRSRAAQDRGPGLVFPGSAPIWIPAGTMLRDLRGRRVDKKISVPVHPSGMPVP